jgi:hypothetical protein
MKKSYIWICSIFIIVSLGFLVRHYFLPSYEPFTVIQQKELLSPEYGHYIYRGTADQTEYGPKLKSKAIGKTQTGDLILEIKNDPGHQYLVLRINTEMPWWDLYELDTR